MAQQLEQKFFEDHPIDASTVCKTFFKVQCELRGQEPTCGEGEDAISSENINLDSYDLVEMSLIG